MTVRIGILGGTFDPIHLGHLEAAAAAQRALSLDRVLLLPSRTPPHRSTEPRASIFHRFAMAALAAAERGMLVSDLEVRREGPSYTALTLEALHREGFAPSHLFFITGSDAFAEVGTWYDYPRVLQLANFVVVSRPGAPSLSDLIPNPRSPIPDVDPTSHLFRWRPTLRMCRPPIFVGASAPANRLTGSCRRASPAISAGITSTCRRQ